MGVSKKSLQWIVPTFFRNEKRIYGLLCKNVNILLNYYKFHIYLKYCTTNALWKLVKMWKQVDVSKIFYNGECYFIFEMKKERKVSCP